MNHISYYKEEYPRPQLWRDSYQLLNGTWDFAFGNNDDACYIRGFQDLKICVPFAYQTPASGINIQERHDVVWYSREVELSEEQLRNDVLLHFEGSDYETTLWVNGQYVGCDQGGYHRISFDCTAYLHPGTNTLVVKVTDDYSQEKPRGKQRWKDESFECYYIDTTGIYKTVWMEFVPKIRVEKIQIDTDSAEETAKLNWRLNTVGEDLQMRVEVSYQGNPVVETQFSVAGNYGRVTLPLSERRPLQLWDVGKPNLYEVRVLLLRGSKELDCVASYFGVRTIRTEYGKVLLNGSEIYQKLVLDQGYWKDTHLTPPSEEALLKDITDMQAMGFNGARKHQKVEDERFLYYADILGYIVWGEMPSMYENTEASRRVFEREWLLAVDQQKNHPCILVWVPFNESWGIREVLTDEVQQDFVNDIYHKTKELDPTRLVITNDGWEHTNSDILTIHHYEQNGQNLHRYFETVEKCLMPVWENHYKGAFAQGYTYCGQPIMISEFGGTAFNADATDGNWGYGQGVDGKEEFMERFRGLIAAVDSLTFCSGYCYTQLSDVQQEVNGLEDADHVSKFNIPEIQKILNESGR